MANYRCIRHARDDIVVLKIGIICNAYNQFICPNFKIFFFLFTDKAIHVFHNICWDLRVPIKSNVSQSTHVITAITCQKVHQDNIPNTHILSLEINPNDIFCRFIIQPESNYGFEKGLLFKQVTTLSLSWPYCSMQETTKFSRSRSSAYSLK